MKKILSLVATFGLIAPSVATVISCGAKTENDVLFVLPGKVMTSTSHIVKAYNEIVDQFNQSEEMQQSNVKVKVRWEEGDAIQLRYNSRQQQPDLYITYPDAASQYVYDENTKNNVRNMEQTYYGTDDNDGSLIDRFWSKSFYEEGIIKNDLYVLPLNKSFDIQVLNLRVFLELVELVDKDLATSIGQGLQAEGLGDKPTELFKRTGLNLDQKLVSDLTPELEKISNAPVKAAAIRDFFKSQDNVLNLAAVYNAAYKVATKNGFGTDKYAKDTNKMFSFGIDSLNNKIYTEYFDAMNKNDPIDPTSAEDKNFFFNLESVKPEDQEIKVAFDNKESTIFKTVSNYFDTFRDLALKTGNQNAADPYLKWSGSMMAGHLNDRSYTSGYFNEGTMLLNASSSAGTWSFNPTNKNNPQFDINKDLMTVSAHTKSGRYYNFLQQGPGLAGFKSIGKNARQKEQVVTKFVKYLLKPKVLNRLAITAGYIPSTGDALAMYKYYKNGSFDNVTGTWRIPETDQPENSADFETIKSGANAYDQKDVLIQQLLDNYLVKLAQHDDHTRLVSTTGNVAGDLVRTVTEDALRNYVLNNLADFETILSGENNEASVLARFYKNLPGNFKRSKARIKSAEEVK